MNISGISEQNIGIYRVEMKVFNGGLKCEKIWVYRICFETAVGVEV